MAEPEYVEIIGREIFDDKTYRQKRNLMTFAVLGLFAERLEINLTEVEIYGISLSPTSAHLIPGFLGLALTYTFIVLCISMYRDWFTYNILYKKVFAGELEKERVQFYSHAPEHEQGALPKTARVVRLFSLNRSILRTNWTGIGVEFGISIVISIYAMSHLLQASWESLTSML